MTPQQRMKMALLDLLSTSALLSGLVLSGCGGGGVQVDEPRSGGDWVWPLPAGFPTPAVPASNPMSAAKVELGRHLFYDPRLSGNGTQSCASCHHQDKAFTDGRALAVGSTGELHPRNAQGLANVVYHATYTWANPSLMSLEAQMQVPIFSDSPVELGVNADNVNVILQRLRDDARYPSMFAEAFGPGDEVIAWGNITRAIASFQRTLISGNSRFDQFQRGEVSFTPQELRGLGLFNGERAECFHCHAGFNFNDQVVHAGTQVLDTPFHNTGLYNIGGSGDFPAGNQGLYEITARLSDRGKFRAPSLRNVEVTAPYMHDGSVATLEAVLDFYAAGGRHITEGPYAGDGRLNPNKSDLITRIDLSAQDKADLVAFLKTLTDDEFLHDPKFSNPFVTP